VAFIHLSAAEVVVVVRAINIVAHDISGVVSEHHMIWALED
jgi:hypothetical protein